jgi:hypothetical protein
VEIKFHYDSQPASVLEEMASVSQTLMKLHLILYTPAEKKRGNFVAVSIIF